MKLRKVIASNFGCLSGSYTLFDDRANVVVEANERGKSTLVAAILAGLYGFPPSRDRDRLSEKETFQPWKTGPYRVNLEVEGDDGRRLLIERDFGERTAKVTDLSPNKDVTQEFRAGKDDFAIGESLLGISREVFIKTCLVKQLEIEEVRRKSSDLVSKVQQIFDTSGGRGTAAAAVSVLEQSVRKYRGTLVGEGKVETEISRLKEEIEKRRARMGELTAERERVAPSMVQLKVLRGEQEELETNRHRLEHLSRKAESGEVESELRSDAKNRTDLEKLIAQKESLKQYKDFPEEDARKLPQLAGRLDELEKQRRQLRHSLEALKRDLVATSSKLREYEGLEGLNEDFKTHLHELWIELARLQQEVEKRKERLSKSEETLRKEGYDLSEMNELFRRFSNLKVEDKDLLRDSEKRIPEIKAEVLELEKAEEKCRKDLRAIKKPMKMLAAVGAVLCLAGIVAVFLSVAAVGVAVAATGVAAVVLGYAVLPRLNLYRIQKLRGEEQGARERRESLLAERDRLVQKLDGMARTAGFETTWEMAEAFKRWGRLQDRAWRLQEQRKEVEAALKDEASGREGVSRELKKMGLDVPPEQVNLTVLRDAEKRVREYLDLTSSLSQMEERRRSAEAETERLQREREGLDQSIRRVLAKSNLPEDLPLEDALPKVEESRKKSETYRYLERTWIPDRLRGLLPPEKVEEMKRRLETLRREIQKMIVEEPGLAGLLPTKRHSEYEEEARKLAKKVTDNIEERGRISREVQNVEDNYRKEYPTLANEIAQLEQTLDKTERFQKSISIALTTLQEISTKSHARWAGTLNETSSEILRHLNPRCRELKFDDDLSFTIVPAEGERPMDQRHIEAQESIGARHQIYLAVRLALTDYLACTGAVGRRADAGGLKSTSRPCRLPVILDDPFATSDDERFLSGMKFLCREFRRNHQVIVLTCHRQRHTELIRQKAPDLAEEMRILEISPPA